MLFVRNHEAVSSISVIFKGIALKITFIMSSYTVSESYGSLDVPFKQKFNLCLKVT